MEFGAVPAYREVPPALHVIPAGPGSLQRLGEFSFMHALALSS